MIREEIKRYLSLPILESILPVSLITFHGVFIYFCTSMSSSLEWILSLSGYDAFHFDNGTERCSERMHQALFHMFAIRGLTSLIAIMLLARWDCGCLQWPSWINEWPFILIHLCEHTGKELSWSVMLITRFTQVTP